MDSACISAQNLLEHSTKLFIKAGVKSDEAALVAGCLVEASLLGYDSHGVLRIAEYLGDVMRGETRSPANLEIITENAANIVAAGHFGFGQVLMTLLLEKLKPKADTVGVVVGTLRDTAHIGRLGEWAERGAANGAITLVMVTDNGVYRSVAPPGGIQPSLSTNPIAIGIPRRRELPFVLDLSTSVVANGKIRMAYASGEQVPAGWLLDAEGNPTRDPAVRVNQPLGSILPLGGEEFGYKGFGLAMMFDVMVSGLCGGFCPPAMPEAVPSNSTLVIQINPRHFCGEAHLWQETERLIDFIRSSPLRPGSKSITLPGDRSSAIKVLRQSQGIPINSGIRKALDDLSLQLGVGPVPYMQ